MAGPQHSAQSSVSATLSSHHYRYFLLGMLCAACIMVLALSGSSSQAFNSSLLSAKTAHASQSSATTASYPVKVFFSKTPESDNNWGIVLPVNRSSPTLGVATFAIQLLIAGPTVEERAAGYYSELNSILTGGSRCAGFADFTLALDKKGTVPQTGTATLTFCRDIYSPGDGVDAHVSSQIKATLKQFSNIKKAVILTKDSHCFGDLTGQDICLA